MKHQKGRSMMGPSTSEPKPASNSDHLFPKQAVFTALRHRVPNQKGQKRFQKIFPAITELSDFHVHAATKQVFKRAKGNIFGSCHSLEHIHAL